MNLLNKKWFKKGNIKVEKVGNEFIIENQNDTHGFLIYPKVFKYNDTKNNYFKFTGRVEYGNGCSLKIVNRHRTVMAQIPLNSLTILRPHMLKYYVIAIYVPAKSKNIITDVQFSLLDNVENIIDEFFKNDTLVVTPGYPSLDNLYNTAFVHTRVKAYQKVGWHVDVAWINNFETLTIYEHEGVKVFKGNYYNLRELLQRKKYKRILIHFFDDKYANVLDSIDTTETSLYFYLHGAETLYRDWTKITSPYFDKPSEITPEIEKWFKIKDYYIEKYNQLENAKWFFVTDWTRRRCEELINIKFNNYDVIPCLIDTNLFSYEKKDPKLRKKIFMLRKYDNINSYSIDIGVRVILELSRRDFFNDLEFDIYGDGTLFDALLEPLKHFKNVHLHRGFLNHEQIRKVHQEHGIMLIPTRYDSQAVSLCEAAASGCAIVSSKNSGIMQFIPEDLNILCETENYKEYADVIERLYYNENEFLEIGRKISKIVSEKFGYKNTIQKELNIMAKEQEKIQLKLQEPMENPILTVIIPAYNVQKYLRHTVMSLLNQPLAHKIEILIVNDGSKDDTKLIGKELEMQTTINGKSIVKLIDKENGGHGSTINKGIELARGKYIKVVDGDDTVDSYQFTKLIEYLENEDVDIVLTNYMEDYAQTNTLNIKNLYSFMHPGVIYHFDDLCFENYGFSNWGPILACSTYKTEMLRRQNFKLSEKMFYVDMELNTYVAIACNTLKYYPLNIYRYLLGREGQSVNKKSYMKNYKHHENVTINMINILEKNKDKISKNKQRYIINKLIIPMIKTQYIVCLDYFNNKKPFREFEKRLKQYDYFYKHENVTTTKIKFHRLTKGYLIKIYKPFAKILKKIIRK